MRGNLNFFLCIPLFALVTCTQEAKRKEAQRLEDENFGSHLAGKIRTFLWNLMEYPETSKYAQVSEKRPWQTASNLTLY